MQRALMVAAGGALGTLLRYLTALAAVRWLGTDFPYGTMIVNLVGSFVIGFVQALGAEAMVLPDDARLFLATGVMGGLTTYSAFSYETVRLMEAGAWSQATINVVFTTIVCLVLCFLGQSVGRMLARG